MQIFEAMLLGSWLSEKDGRKLEGISAHIDQAALHGLLKKVRDTGLTLIAVNQIL